jgi:4-amino-4-deoxy-L-arabinose transferase-like glycosyltransferase
MGEPPEQDPDEVGGSELVPGNDVGKAQMPKRSYNPGIKLGLLSTIIVVGIVLRFWGIGWSLPDKRHPLATFHPDERVDFVVNGSFDITAGKFDIGYYNYGALYFYLVDLAKTMGHTYGAIPTTPSLPAGSPQLTALENAERRLPETRGNYLAGRVISALMGVLTIPVLFALGRRLYGETTGLISALIYAVLPLAVVNAHFYTVDVGATLFVALALLWSARLLEMQSWQNYVVAGVWAGLAAATKYSAGLVIVAPVAAYLIVTMRTGKTKPPLTGLAILFASTTIVFLIGCPGPLINWGAFWDGLSQWPNSGVRYELLEHPRLGHGLLFVNTGPGWWYHLVISLRYGLGLPMLALVCVGFITAARMRTEPDRLMLWFVLLFYGITGLSGVRFARYMIPLYPAFCVLAARIVLELKPLNSRRYAVQAAMGLVILLTAGYSASLVREMALKDPRDAAADYLEAHAGESPTVAFAKTPWYFSPPLSPWFGEMSPEMRSKYSESTRFKFLLSPDKSEFDTSVLTPPPDFVVISNIETINELRLDQPAAKRFPSSIPGNYRQIVFAPYRIFNMAFSSTSTGLVPDDLLYILPRITVYQKP